MSPTLAPASAMPSIVLFARMTKWKEGNADGPSNYLLSKAQSLVEAVDEG